MARQNDDLDFLPPSGGEPHGYDEFIASVDAIVRRAEVVRKSPDDESAAVRQEARGGAEQPKGVLTGILLSHRALCEKRPSGRITSNSEVIPG
jgi:hypothetical protein